jgi:serine/threonine-protein kinase
MIKFSKIIERIKSIPFNKVDLLTGSLVAVIFIFFSFNAFMVFESIEKVLYGIEMRFDPPRSMGENRIAIVNIDKKSLKDLGPWPWPRHVIADMITILKNNGAKLIGLDVIFSENEQNEGLFELRKLYKAVVDKGKTAETYSWILDSLEGIEKKLDNDTMLAQTVKESGNIILPVMGVFGKYDTELVLTEDSFLKKNSMRSTPQLIWNTEDCIPVQELITPFQELSENSRGLGHINLSPNELMEGQAHLPVINFRGHIIPSLPLRLTLDYLNKVPEEAIVQGRGIRLTDPIIPTKGEILIKFRGGRRSFPYYSFVDILKVKKVPAVFDDKIVLIGYTAEGASSINTPVDPQMPRVELTANVIEDLMRGRFLKRPDSMKYIEGLLLIALALFSSFALPRTSLVNRMGMTAGLLLLVFLIGVISFIALDIWFKIVYIGLSLITIYVVNLVGYIAAAQKELDITSKESIETNRMLGLTLQSQGLFDLAFEKFRKCPLDDTMKDVVYNLGLDYERKRMINKAISVYEYINQKDHNFKKLDERIPKLRNMDASLRGADIKGKKEEKIVVADDLEIKPTVGRYEIVKELGKGAMGIVYLAKDPKINRDLAIKTIRFSDEFEESRVKEVKERFFREAEIAGKLSHPSIVSIYDVGEDYELTYLAMEYLEGEDLQGHCTEGSLLPLRTVLHIISETASALDYAHSRGVVHRDVKPANIMILKDGRIKVTDFGIAKAVSSSQTKSGVVLGTPNYMSPEQINGLDIDGRSDIFSLGVVFFELLTGQLPFRSKTLTNLLYMISQAKHPSPREINPKVPKPCEQIINKSLTKAPEGRFQRADDLVRYVKAMIGKIDELKAGAQG